MERKEPEIGSRVEILGKELKGKVAFIGYTNFSAGKWFGVVLDGPNGKNNGCINGITYFSCPDKHGIFVRQTQLQVIEDNKAISRRASLFSTPVVSKNLFLDRGSQQKRRMTFSSAIPKVNVERTRQKNKLREHLPRHSSTADLNQSPFNDSLYQQPKGSTTSNSSSFELQTLLLQKDQEMDKLKTEIKDLGEKLETLKVLRAEDQSKLQEMRKMRLQLTQLLEYKAKIAQVQASLQKELNDAKKKAKEAIEAKEKQAEEMSDLVEATELAVLDKEMTEEKLEALQAELEQAREKYEELSINYEVLKKEISKGEEFSTSYQMRQLELQNEKLKQAVVQMRDLSARDKQEGQKHMKEIQQMKDDIKELRSRNEELNHLISGYEKEIVELKEQMDIAFGAEQVIEQLSERNLTLEDRVVKLQLSVDELEQLQEINEQLQETAKETESELREEIDMIKAKLLKEQQKIQALHEVIADGDLTINKFREQTVKLRNKNIELQDLLNNEKDKLPVPKSEENIAFKVRNCESKSFIDSLELDVKSVELELTNKHINYLCAFMPDEFLSQGGDHDAILVLLLISRMISKIEILTSRIKIKFPAPELITKDGVLKSHVIDQYGFACRFLYQLYFLLSLLNQYAFILSNCDLKLFMKFRLLYIDMVVAEKSLDVYFDLLKKDDLAENIDLEPLVKTRKYFHDIYNTNLGLEMVDSCVFMQDHLKLIVASCESIHTDVSSIMVFVESSDAEFWPKDICRYANDVCHFAKKIRRFIPTNRSTSDLMLPSVVQERLKTFRQDLGQVMEELHMLRKSFLQEIDTSCTSKNAETISLQYTKVCGKECTPGSRIQLLNLLAVYFNQLYFEMLEGTYEVDSSKYYNRNPPVYQRAQIVKNEARDLKILKFKLKAREDDIFELKKSMNLKCEELSKMCLHKGIVEKKLGLAIKDKAERIDELQRQLKEERLELSKKEKEFEETLDHLQTDIESLEAENSLLKNKLNSMKDLTSSSVFSTNSFGMSDSFALCDNLLSHQEQNLLSSLKNIKSENFRLQTVQMRKQLENLPPLVVPKKNVFPSSAESVILMDGDCTNVSNFAMLTKRYKVLSKKVMALCCPLVVDISRKKVNEAGTEISPINYFVLAAEQAKIVQDEILKLKLLINSRIRGKREVKADFPMLPTVALPFDTNIETKLAARIKIPRSNINRSGTVPLLLGKRELKQVHSVIL